jgi:stage II sporulation protein D
MNNQRSNSDDEDDDHDSPEEKITDHVHYIRVLLEEHASHETCNLTFKAKDGFVLESPAHSNITVLYQAEELSLLIKDGQYFLRCQDGKYRKVKYNDLEICSPHNKIMLNGKVYQGSLYICQDKNTSSMLVINKLDLEDYLYSVLRHEGIPSWPLEMHKVQAIASRTYALYHMKQSRIKNPNTPYDLKNTSHFQIYDGSHEVVHLRKAVEETRNMVLTYKGNIALAMFDICCGGIVPALLRKRDTSKPYLCRKEPCLYCKNTVYYSWKELVNDATALDCLKNYPKCKNKLTYFGNTLVDMRVLDTDKAGVAHTIKCIGKKANVILTASEVKSALQGRLKSLAFSIKKEGHRLIFCGHGNSHFKGLCQWGAKELVDRGWNCKEILQFYYPNTKLSYLK